MEAAAELSQGLPPDRADGDMNFGEGVQPVPTAARIDALIQQIDHVLRQQTEAAHSGDADLLAKLGKQSLALVNRVHVDLRELQECQSSAEQTRAEAARCADRVTLLAKLAMYNQLLIRYAYTSWAATCFDRRRRSPGYNAQGKRTRPKDLPEHKGHLAKGTL